ncbi:hypothetical protein J6590_031263 [Homalodisca vitripennis]|nr:hypothetical protein J6590_031263 [Homalodisca vitripennis]
MAAPMSRFGGNKNIGGKITSRAGKVAGTKKWRDCEMKRLDISYGFTIRVYRQLYKPPPETKHNNQSVRPVSHLPGKPLTLFLAGTGTGALFTLRRHRAGRLKRRKRNTVESRRSEPRQSENPPNPNTARRKYKIVKKAGK